MSIVAAVIACLLLAALAVFQGMLIAGWPLGRFAWGGQHEVLPRHLRIGSAISLVLYAVFAIIIVERADLSRVLPAVIAEVGIWVLTAYFALGIIMNGLSRSRPERNLMAPVSAALAVLCLVVALG